MEFGTRDRPSVALGQILLARAWYHPHALAWLVIGMVMSWSGTNQVEKVPYSVTCASSVVRLFRPCCRRFLQALLHSPHCTLCGGAMLMM